jgi:C-terminal processing protease CtpA/Prc
MAAIGLAHADTSPAMQYYDQIQQMREDADKLVDEKHPDPAHLQAAIDILHKALVILDQPLAKGLGDGNVHLSSRHSNVLFQLAEYYALQGNKQAALDALEASNEEVWIPSFYSSYARQDESLSSLRNEPRFKAILANSDAMNRLWGSKPLATPYKPQLSDAERVAGLSLFWSEVKYNFAHFDRVPQLDWDQTYLDFLPRVIAAKDTASYYEVLMQLAPLLHDGHTNIYPPEALMDHFAAYPPIDTELVDGQVLITDVQSPTISRMGVHVGDEVVSVDGQDVHRYAEEHVAPYQSAETPQDRDVRLYNYGLLLGDVSRPVQLTLRDAHGQTHDVTVSRGKYPDIRQQEGFSFRMLPGNIAYLALDEFADDKGVKAFEAHMKDIVRSNGLILDVRNNGGGSSSYGFDVLTYLSEQPLPGLQGKELQISPYDRSNGQLIMQWKKLVDWGQPYHRDRVNHFQKPVAVLIGPRSFSAAEDFVAVFKAMKRGLLVGAATAGSSGHPLLFDLPGGGEARVCVVRETLPDGTEFVGKGIEPDVVVTPTADDIRAHRDPVVDRAAELLRKRDAMTASR